MPNDNICLLYFMGTLLRERFAALGRKKFMPCVRERNTETEGGKQRAEEEEEE